VFGGRPGARPQSNRGEDIRIDLTIPFMDACKGTKRTVTVHPVVNCSTCSGSGMKKGAQRSTCSSCNGSGLRTFVLDNGFKAQTTCSTCQGEGTTIPRGSQCGSCQGVGKQRTMKQVEVDVPAGALSLP
jgi:molecular chaperone DnaJ